jgi:hypothetical protein
MFSLYIILQLIAFLFGRYEGLCDLSWSWPHLLRLFLFQVALGYGSSVRFAFTIVQALWALGDIFTFWSVFWVFLNARQVRALTGTGLNRRDFVSLVRLLSVAALHLYFVGVLNSGDGWLLASSLGANRLAHSLNGNIVGKVLIIALILLIITLPLLAAETSFYHKTEAMAREAKRKRVTWVGFIRGLVVNSHFGFVIGAFVIVLSPVLFVVLFVFSWISMAILQWKSHRILKEARVKLVVDLAKDENTGSAPLKPINARKRRGLVLSELHEPIEETLEEDEVEGEIPSL